VITVKEDSDVFKLYFHGSLHVHFLRKHYRGLSSYNENIYTIEILLRDQEIRLEYDNRDHWLAVLAALDEYI